MGKKVYLVIGLGVGYVLGARAGRKRYDQIKAGAQKFWGSEPIQTGVQQIQGLAADAGAQASQSISDGARKLVHAVTGPDAKPAASRTTTAAKKPATKSAARPAAKKPAARKPAAKKPAASDEDA
jgi:hypothetical protein